jgi:hypothetical protein
MRTIHAIASLFALNSILHLLQRFEILASRERSAGGPVQTGCRFGRYHPMACLLAIIFAAGAPLTALALEAPSEGGDSPSDQPGKQWALLIGIEKYHQASPLRFTIRDVSEIAKTLKTRGGVTEDRMIEITDQASQPRYQPLRASLMSLLPQWLSKPGPNDQILVYFSGHGFRDKDGHMYLAPIDCDPKNPTETGISIEWFREQIARCPAKFKLLVIDACHAGSEKGETDDDTVVAAKDLGEPFRDLTGVVTLASSTGDEKSQIWEEKQQSLFSYWFNQGLKGHADENADSTIDVDELNKYVHGNVVRTARIRFPRSQTPVRIHRSGTPGVPTVLHLKPLSLNQTLADLSEQLTYAMQEQKFERLAVLEFTNDTALGELLGADFGLLGRYCAEALEKQLGEIGDGAFRLVDRRRLQSALREQQFKIDDLGSPNALDKLSTSVSGMPVMALGTLRNRAGRVVTLQCKLVETETGDLIASAGGTAWLNESEWAMLGRSAQIKSHGSAVEAPSLDNEESENIEDTQTTHLVNHLDTQAEEPHPLLDPKFPYQVRVKVNGQVRKGVFRGNDLYIPVRKGEKYELEVENRSGHLVLMRLLVDGLNTLPEKEETKGISTMLVAPRVNLADARHWILDPAKSKMFLIRGFVTETGAAGKLREFLVTDASQSLAARQQFTDQIGMITAAFYAPQGRGLGTTAGDEQDEKIVERSGTQVGEMLAVVNIRYVDADELNSQQ